MVDAPGAVKKKRRSLMYPTIGEDWGEHPDISLAGEQTPPTAPPQTGSSPNTAREHLAVLGASHTPKVQPMLTKFFNKVDRVPL